MECSHKTYNIYCDESTHLENDGQPYMIYGYVSIPYNEMALAKKQIREIKQKHGYEEELKWTNISIHRFQHPAQLSFCPKEIIHDRVVNDCVILLKQCNHLIVWIIHRATVLDL